MRIPSGKVDQVIYFMAVDSTDLKTPETGLTSFTVYRSRNGGAAVAYTTPTITEISAANMPGLYSLLIDEDTTIASTSDSEEYCVLITQASMRAVPRTFELYRRDTTSGNTALVDANGRMDVIKVAGTTQTAGDIIADTNDIQARLPAALTAGGNIKADALAWNGLTTVELPLVPTTAGRKLDVSAGGEAGIDWANIGSPTTAVNLSATNIDVDQVVASVSGAVGSVATGGIVAASFGAGAIDAAAIATDAIGSAEISAAAVTKIQAGLATPTNITAGTITTVTNLTNAPTAGDLTATMKTSVTTAATAATPTAAAVTGNVGGNVVGSVGSVVGLTPGNLDSVKVVTDRVDALIEDAGAYDRWSVQSLEMIYSIVRSAVFDAEIVPEHTIGGTFGGLFNDTGLASAAIQTKTDQLTFTVAGQVDSNIQAVNDIQIGGNGQESTPWGPA